MKLVVVTPQQTYAVEGVDRVSVPGSAGRFAVLRGHAPLLSTLTRGAVRYRCGGEEKELEVSGGVVRVERNEVSVIIEHEDKK